MTNSTAVDISTRLILPDQPERWRAFLPASRSVFGSVEFCSVVQRHQGLQPGLYVFSDSPAQIAYPFFLRGVDALPYCSSETRGYDIRTPEYTGPVPLQPVTPRAADAFRQAFHRLCVETGIIAEFAHLHPWASNHALLNPDGIRLDRQIIYVDLSLPVERLWEESFTHACRKNINRARRENVRVFPARTAADIQEFHRIYTGTMDRNQAAGHYYFPLSYFTEIMQALPDNALMLLAEYKDQVIAGTLYMHDDHNIYSYLGGADQAFQQVRPTNQVVYEVIRWGQEQGKSRLILGGGYRPDDGIFRFKASFSPLRANFFVYRAVHLSAEYSKLCQAWATYYAAPLEDGRYFPLYRAAPPQPETETPSAAEPPAAAPPVSTTVNS